VFAFVVYQLKSFGLSLKFIPPATLYFAWVFISYAYKNVPILSSYGSTAMVLYPIMAWMTMALFHLEEESEKHILFSHLGNKGRYLLGKWLTLLVTMFPLLLFAIFYPIITSSFKGNMSFELFSIGVYVHLVFSAFGMLVGSLFSTTNLATKKYSWLSAALVMVVSFSAKSMIEGVAFIKWILWVVPPVFDVLSLVGNGDGIFLNTSSIMNDVWVILYLMIGFTILVPLYRKKES
jgi:hypothetical protein